MFKWSCLGTGVLFGLILLWMVNDLRLEVRRSVDTVNKDLPQIVDKSRQVAETVHGNLPHLVDKTKATAETLATLSQDVKQLRELVVGEGGPRDSGLAAYETEVLKLVENSGGVIGVKKTLGKGLADPITAKEWIVRERKMALWDLARARSKGELLDRIGRSTVLGRVWHIQIGNLEPTPLTDWVKANHPASKEP